MFMAKRIPLREQSGDVVAHAIVDDADYQWVMQWRWCLTSNKKYARRNTGKAGILTMHRALLGLTDPKVDGDHLNGDGLDNRRSNLKPKTRQGNRQNTWGYPSSSKYRGVYWDATRQKWKAQLTVNYKNYGVGRFDDELVAAHAVHLVRLEVMPGSEERELPPLPANTTFDGICARWKHLV